MANCPNCGSEHIQLKKDTNVDWGRAVAGWTLFGVVGGAVGAVTGEDRSVNACLDCGTFWKAADLYKILQVIKKYTGITLNLAHEKDRNFINDFINEITPYIEAISKAEAEGILIIRNSENKLTGYTAIGIPTSFIIYLLILMVLFLAIARSIFGILIIVFLILLFIGYSQQKSRKNNASVEKEIKKARRQAETINIQAEENLKRQIHNFIDRHPL